MHDTSIPVLVLSQRFEDVETFNKTLRDSGYPVRCRGLTSVDDLGAAIDEESPHLLVLFRDRFSAGISDVARLRTNHATATPLIVIADSVDEPAIADALQAGAQDLVSLAHKQRICAVCERELRAFSLERALNSALRSTEDYRSEFQSLLSSSADAIAVIQEGIVVDANLAWADVFAAQDIDSTLGPLMDFFAGDSQAKLKSALVACGKGQWDGSALVVDVVTSSGDAVSVKMTLESSIYDGEPATRLCIVKQTAQDVGTPDQTGPVKNSDRDYATGFLCRKPFLQSLANRLSEPKENGSRALVCLRPDKFKQIEHAVGPILSEEIIVQIAETLNGHLRESDLTGRFGGTVLAILLERSSLEEIVQCVQLVLREIAGQLYEVANHSLSLTCSAGIAEISSQHQDLEELLRLAENANQRCRQEGGNRAILEETTDANTLIKRADALWVQRIKAALVEERFRLLHFSIASLSGTGERMFDTFVRMIDEQGDEIEPSEFIASARRNQLLRPLDRWIIDASFRFCTEQPNDLVFVKVSDESILDTHLYAWIDELTKKHGIDSSNICFQVNEDDASRYLRQTQTLSETLRRKGFRFAVENFGTGRDPEHVLRNTPMDFVKFDGSLMRAISEDVKLQGRVRELTALATRKGIKTVATHIENANSMAVLFQIGVGYMQGHYLQEPEVVLEEAV